MTQYPWREESAAERSNRICREGYARFQEQSDRLQAERASMAAPAPAQASGACCSPYSSPYSGSGGGGSGGGGGLLLVALLVFVGFVLWSCLYLVYATIKWAWRTLSPRTPEVYYGTARPMTPDDTREAHASDGKLFTAE